MPRYFDQQGRRFAVVAVFPDRDPSQANDYMTTHTGVGALATHNGLVYLANCADKGAPVAGLPPLVHERVTVQTKRHEMASTTGDLVMSLPMFEVTTESGEVLGRFLSRDVAERVADALNADLTPTTIGVQVARCEVLSWHATSDGRAFILEPDGTTVCEILAPALNNRASIARDIVHAQLSAVKLLFAAKELLGKLVEGDDEGLVEHAEPVVGMREAVAYAEGRA